jgi:two-component system phosphate regulon sensor histidine kinase PhoR
MSKQTKNIVECSVTDGGNQLRICKDKNTEGRPFRNPLIDVVIEDVKKKNPKVSFSFEKERPVLISSNKSLAIQIFSNLISNAAEYSDKTAGNVHTILKNEGLYCIFSVENNGSGIPIEDQSKIFSKFFRASNAPEIKKSGTGLGLFIVKMICDNFGWQIWFQSPLSDQDRGTVFFIKIPTKA